MFTGRVIRNTITAVLTIVYGPEIVHVAEQLATRHRVALLAGMGLLLALLMYWVWRKLRTWRLKNGEITAEES